MKYTIILPKSQTQKLWKPVYSHQMPYNLCFYILTRDNDTHNVCTVVNKVRPCSLFGLKTAGLGCFHFYLFFPVCAWRILSFEKYYYSSACWNWIILFLHNFSWDCSTYKEIQLNFPCRQSLIQHAFIKLACCIVWHVYELRITEALSHSLSCVTWCTERESTSSISKNCIIRKHKGFSIISAAAI